VAGANRAGNGAGKTTLLKILSRITRPYGGLGRDNGGRVRSLLEVGTGFSSGADGGGRNAYLSGAILGMGKREIDRKIRRDRGVRGDREILSRRPVKHYSTGMYMRLAFFGGGAPGARDIAGGRGTGGGGHRVPKKNVWGRWRTSRREDERWCW